MYDIHRDWTWVASLELSHAFTLQLSASRLDLDIVTARQGHPDQHHSRRGKRPYLWLAHSERAKDEALGREVEEGYQIADHGQIVHGPVPNVVRRIKAHGACQKRPRAEQASSKRRHLVGRLVGSFGSKRN